MNRKVKDYLERQKANENKKKEEILKDLELTEKVYSPDGKRSDEYYLSEWDNSNSSYRYFKRVPVEVTDEEYEEIKKYTKNDKTNPIATTLTIIAFIVYLAGFVAGIILGNNFAEYYDEFSLATAFSYWGTAAISGTLFLGFAEIIKLLEAIKNK